MQKAQRFMNLEGLRGIAAIVVVLYHSITMFYPGIAYGSAAAVQNMRFEDNIYGSPINVFLSGGFAVGIFFVLSGFVLSVGYFQTGKEAIVKKLASKRYLRLMIPALASVLFAFLLLSLHFNANREAAVAITHSGTSGEWSFALNIFDAIKQGTFDIFFGKQTYYNPVLWTMLFEFIGSFIVFGTLLLFGKSKYRRLIYAVLIIFTFNTWFLGFILGMLIADTYVNKNKLENKKSIIYGGGMLFIGLFLGGYPFGPTMGTVYDFINISWLGGSNNAFYISIGSALVVASILFLPKLSNFFASPRISNLGKYTYSLYLTHYIILTTLTTSLFIFFSQWFGLNKAALLSVICSLPVVALSAWLFERYVDVPAIKFSNYFTELMSGKRKLPKKIKIIEKYIKSN